MESGENGRVIDVLRHTEPEGWPDAAAMQEAWAREDLKPGISGYVCVRNGLKLDYCWELAVASLLPVCDEVLICDSDSTDGTREAIERWMEHEPKLRYINYPWPAPKGQTQWWVAWMNFARQHLHFDHQLQLDADEVLDTALFEKLVTQNPDSPAYVSLTFDRLNFWGSPRTLIPEGQCCGKFVVRFGPSYWWMPSDEPRHAGESEMIDNQIRLPELPVIYHLGFLRRKEAFYAKAKVVLGAFFNRYDERLERAEKAKKALADSECEWKNALVPYTGDFPEPIRKWLENRGYTI